MNRRRLLRLADLLEKDAANKKGVKFDLHAVGEASYGDGHDDFKAELNCGTTACAMGLAAISGAFKRSGLSYKIDGVWVELTMNGRKVEFDRAGQILFDISDYESKFLFTPSYYPDNKRSGAAGERYVAKRIRDFVAGKVAP